MPPRSRQWEEWGLNRSDSETVSQFWASLRAEVGRPPSAASREEGFSVLS